MGVYVDDGLAIGQVMEMLGYLWQLGEVLELGRGVHVRILETINTMDISQTAFSCRGSAGFS